MSTQPAARDRPQQASLPETPVGIAFAELASRSCRWPIGGSGAGLRCCGAKTVASGAAYCAEHRARAVRPDPEPAPTHRRRREGRRQAPPLSEKVGRPLDAMDLASGLPDPTRGDGVGLADPWG